MLVRGVRLVLVRHGETLWNREGRLLGWTDLPLTEEGKAQARALKEKLAPFSFRGVYSSDLLRARQTALLAYGPAEAVFALREIHFGRLEGLSWEALGPAHREALLRLEGFVAPGGESLLAFRARVFRFLEGLPPGVHLLFTHGGVVRLLLKEVGADLLAPPGSAFFLDGEGGWAAL